MDGISFQLKFSTQFDVFFKKKRNSKTDEGYGHVTHNKVDAAMFIYALILVKPDKCEWPVKG